MLTGTSADEVLIGYAGNDTLMGGGGADTYIFARGGGSDIILNTEHAADEDKVLFCSGIAKDQLWFEQLADNLKVSIIGTTDSITIGNWYSDAANHVSALQTADGTVLTDTDIHNLVAAMATLIPPSIGQTTLNAVQHQQLDSVITVNWH